MKMKKFISILIVAAMLFSVAVVPASAVDSTVAGSTTGSTVTDLSYVADYDRDTPIIIVHGMSQNDTYLLNPDGTRMTDSNGDYITGWPLEIDIMGLLKEALGPLLMSVVKGKDMGLTDAMRKGAYEGLYAIHKDNEGNYLTPVEVPC